MHRSEPLHTDGVIVPRCASGVSARYNHLHPWHNHYHQCRTVHSRARVPTYRSGHPGAVL